MKSLNGDEQKELAEYVIKKILDGMVFIIAEDPLIYLFEDGSPSRFERTGKEVKVRGFEGIHNLYFTKNDDHFKKRAYSIVQGAGANFETLLGIILEHSRPHCHVYYTGDRFDLDKLNDMVYTLFTESGIDKIKETRRTVVHYVGKNRS